MSAARGESEARGVPSLRAPLRVPLRAAASKSIGPPGFASRVAARPVRSRLALLKDIIVRGVETDSTEIEDLLCEHPGAAQVAVVGAPDP